MIVSAMCHVLLWKFGLQPPPVLSPLAPDGLAVGRVGVSPRGTPRLPVPEVCALILQVSKAAVFGSTGNPLQLQG